MIFICVIFRRATEMLHANIEAIVYEPNAFPLFGIDK